MFNLLKKLHANDVELKIDKTSVSGTVVRFTLRSGFHCMSRYYNLDEPVSIAESDRILKSLYTFYKEFMEEKGRREYLAETLVSTYEQEQKDFLQERRKVLAENRLRPATDEPGVLDLKAMTEWREYVENRLRPGTDGGDICDGQERKTEEER